MIFKTASGAPLTKISWEVPTKRTDGTPYKAGEHKGYTLGRADSEGVIRPFVSIPAAFNVTEWPLNKLSITAPGNYIVALATVDSTDQESDYSTTVNFIAAWAPPNAPTGLTVS